MTRERTCKPALHVAAAGLMFAQTWPITYIHHNQTAATSEWVTIYRDDSRNYTRGSLGFEAPGRLDHLAERRATMRHAFSLAWDHAPFERGVRSSRGVSRRVERPPEWTGGGEW